MLPEVASGGYDVKAPLNPILEIGVLLDLWVRHFTAEFFPTGVYYPEPNTLRPHQGRRIRFGSKFYG